jgi:hypothetical protein
MRVIGHANSPHQVPFMVSEGDMDILHQALSHFIDHLRDLGVDPVEVERLQERLGQAEDQLIEG